MFTLKSDAREVIEGCRAEIVKHGTAVEHCSQAARGLAFVGRRNVAFKDCCDNPDLAMMICQVLILDYLEAMFDREAVEYIAARCAEHRRASAYLLHIRGEGMPKALKEACRANMAEHYRAGVHFQRLEKRPF